MAFKPCFPDYDTIEGH